MLYFKISMMHIFFSTRRRKTRAKSPVFSHIHVKNYVVYTYRGDCIKSLGWINYLTQLVSSTETSHKKSYYHPHHLSNLGILSLLITKVGT